VAEVKCTHWLGHKFEARYSKSGSTASAYNSYEGPAIVLVDLAEKSRIVTYERDVCVRCGFAIEKSK
jgi:uncharacterized membrane protein YgdD (TMEM256/DUF423 family)